MKRFRVSVREMLLIMALFAIVFAWIAVRIEMRRTHMRGQLKGIELWREFASTHPGIYTNESAWRSNLQSLDADIADRKKALGHVDEDR
jgi:hypothetical protein